MTPDGLPIRAVQSTKLADLIARDLRMRIIRGEVKEGAELPTLDRLAASFGVSLAVIREAVRILETENLLSIRRGAKGGVEVHAPNLDTLARNFGLYLQYQQTTMQDLLTAQLGIEPLCAGLLAAKPKAKVIKALSNEVDRAEALLDDMTGFSEASVEFQRTLVALTGNKTLTAMHAAIVHLKEFEIVAVRGRVAQGSSSSTIRETFLRSIERKRRLIALIAAGDVRGAEAQWREYLEGHNRFLLSRDPGKLVIDLFGPSSDEEAGATRPGARRGQKATKPGRAPPARRSRQPA